MRDIKRIKENGGACCSAKNRQRVDQASLLRQYSRPDGDPLAYVPTRSATGIFGEAFCRGWRGEVYLGRRMVFRSLCKDISNRATGRRSRPRQTGERFRVKPLPRSVACSFCLLRKVCCPAPLFKCADFSSCRPFLPIRCATPHCVNRTPCARGSCFTGRRSLPFRPSGATARRHYAVLHAFLRVGTTHNHAQHVFRRRTRTTVR